MSSLRLATGATEGFSVLEEYSDYADPPTPKTPQQIAPAPQSKNKGRFGALNRNEMVQRVGESEFDMFLLGDSITDYVFFDQEVGSLDGPFKGPRGYYIPRVISRSDPTRPPLSLAEGSQRDLIMQDFMSCSFNDYAQAVLNSPRTSPISGSVKDLRRGRSPNARAKTGGGACVGVIDDSTRTVRDSVGILQS